MFKFITQNFGYKLASIVLAIFVWAIVQGEEIVELNKKLVVRIRVPNDLILKEDPYFELDATVKGPRFIMGDLLERPDIETTLFVRKTDRGKVRLRISRSNFLDWDDRIRLQVHEPSTIEFFVDEKVTQKLPIREILQGAPAEGYLVEKVSIEPKVVEVTSLKSELKATKELITETLDITGIQQSKSFETKILARGLSRAELSEATVTVNLKVGEAKENRKFSRIPVSVVGAKNVSGLKPPFVTIEIQATPGILSVISPSDLRAIVDLAGFRPGRHEMEVQVKIPADTVLIDTFPQKVVVRIPGMKR
jgi:YbbR domain-containing protein